MSSSNVWTRSRARMRLFPEMMAQCSGEVHLHSVFLPQYCYICMMHYIMNLSFCCCLYIGLFFYYYIIRQPLMVNVWPPQPLANRSWPKTCVSKNLKHWKAAFNQLWGFFVIMYYIDEYFLTSIPFTQTYIRVKIKYIYIYLHLHLHLADAFIQSDLQCIIHGYTFFYQYVFSLGIEPTTFALLTQCSTTEPQEHLMFINIICK